MYDYVSLKRVEGELSPSVPSDNMLVNGRPLNELVPGYRHLTVTGRGLVGQSLKTTKVPGRRGVWVDDYSDDERQLDIKYQLTAGSSSELRESFALLNRILRTPASSGFLEVSFRDEPDYVYYAYFSESESIEETSLSLVSKFSLLVPDGYKKKQSQESRGPISLVDAVAVLPESITVTPTGTVNQIQILNGRQTISFRGAYQAGRDLVIRFGQDEITASYGGRSILSELERYSPLELFTVRDGDVITARNATVKQVVWRDERL